MTILLILLGAALLVLLLVAPGRASAAQRAPFQGVYFAHRGLHAPDKTVPENSLAAFRLAAEAGYGVELDVRLTADGQVVVFHDNTTNRLCGEESGGRVDSFTYEELQALSLCGTEERIPLFSDVLELMADRVPMIVELKTGSRNRELCEKTCALLRQRRGSYCIESFDPTIVRWFRRNAPELLRGQLATGRGGYASDGRPPLTSAVLSWTLLNFLGRPQFIAFRIGPKPLTVRLAEALGAMRVGWVARTPAEEAGLDAVIFEFYRPPLRRE